MAALPSCSTASTVASSPSTSRTTPATCAAGPAGPVSAADVQAFVVFAPGEGMERFIRAAGAVAADGPPEVEDVLVLAAAHGIELTRPLPGRG